MFNYRELSTDVKKIWEASNVYLIKNTDGTYWLNKYRWNDYIKSQILSRREVNELIKKRDKVVVVDNDGVRCYKFDCLILN